MTKRPILPQAPAAASQRDAGTRLYRRQSQQPRAPFSCAPDADKSESHVPEPQSDAQKSTNGVGALQSATSEPHLPRLELPQIALLSPLMSPTASDASFWLPLSPASPGSTLVFSSPTSPRSTLGIPSPRSPHSSPGITRSTSPVSAQAPQPPYGTLLHGGWSPASGNANRRTEEPERLTVKAPGTLANACSAGGQIEGCNDITPPSGPRHPAEPRAPTQAQSTHPTHTTPTTQPAHPHDAPTDRPPRASHRTRKYSPNPHRPPARWHRPDPGHPTCPTPPIKPPPCTHPHPQSHEGANAAKGVPSSSFTHTSSRRLSDRRSRSPGTRPSSPTPGPAAHAPPDTAVRPPMRLQNLVQDLQPDGPGRHSPLRHSPATEPPQDWEWVNPKPGPASDAVHVNGASSVIPMDSIEPGWFSLMGAASATTLIGSAAAIGDVADGVPFDGIASVEGLGARGARTCPHKLLRSDTQAFCAPLNGAATSPAPIAAAGVADLRHPPCAPAYFGGEVDRPPKSRARAWLEKKLGHR